MISKPHIILILALLAIFGLICAANGVPLFSEP